MQDQYQKSNYKSSLCSYTKSHYELLQKLIHNRFMNAYQYKINDRIFPLRERGSLLDPWNVAFIFSILFLSALFRLSVISILLEGVMIGCLVLNIYSKNKILYFVLSILVDSVKFLVYLNLSLSIALPCVLQMMIIITHFLLCYSPQIGKTKISEIRKQFKKEIGTVVLGEYALELLCSLKKHNK